MRNLKKILLFLAIIFVSFGINIQAQASESGAVNFFNAYIREANGYSDSILGMYSPNAKIIRQVIKPSGQLVNVPFSMKDYRRQLILSGHIAKIRHYKNYYSDIHVAKDGSNAYKITAYRRPSTGGGKLKTTMIVNEQHGKWMITEEIMQTREQIFLKYAK